MDQVSGQRKKQKAKGQGHGMFDLKTATSYDQDS